MVEAAVREVGKGQITQDLRGHSKEVSFIQSAAGQQGFNPGSNLIQFVFCKDPLVYCVDNWVQGSQVEAWSHE